MINLASFEEINFHDFFPHRIVQYFFISACYDKDCDAT